MFIIELRIDDVADVTEETCALSSITFVRVALLMSHQVLIVEFVIVVIPVVDAACACAIDGA